MNGLELTRKILAVTIEELDAYIFDRKDTEKNSAINHLKSALTILSDPDMPDNV